MKDIERYVALLLCVLGILFGVYYIYLGSYIKALLFLILGIGWGYIVFLGNRKRSRR
ncbi:hypothetical protein GNF72_18030 [Clostridium perfringens]|jgi:hypothetical protein|uniref:hypothetical protein n=1 Tax=Clostridium perfringens TaxID=1502 RepID=UPI002AC5DDB1|nr:hypothetical protein [Clostridium perfringens]MDZ5017065.1 hypothetical protein [Clostridium perfringens]